MAGNGYFGYRYYPQLDDWYFGVGHLDTALGYLVHSSYAIRPASALVQAFIVTRIWPHLSTLFLSLTLLVAATALLAKEWLHALRIEVGPLFHVFFILNPIVFEGEYWIAASIDIIPGLFFAVLANVLLIRLHALRPRLAAASYILFSLFAYGFYEQLVSVGLLMGLVTRTRLPNANKLKTLLLVAWPVAAITSYYLYFHLQVHARGASRERFISGGVITYLHYLFSIASVLSHLWFGRIAQQFYLNGIPRGLGVLLLNHDFVYGVLAVLIAFITGISVYFYEKSPRGTHRSKSRALVLGGMLFLFGYAPFLILNYPWIALRNNYIPGLGAAIILDTLVLSGNLRSRLLSNLRVLLIGLFTFLLLLVRISDLSDYRQNTWKDISIAHQLIHRLGPEHDALIIGGQWSYIQTDVGYLSHIVSAFAENYGCGNLMYTLTGRPYHIEPLIAGQIYRLPPNWERYKAYGITTTGVLFPLLAVREAPTKVAYLDAKGRKLGTVVQTGVNVRFIPG